MKGASYEDPYSSYLPRQARKHRAQDGLLAGGIRRAVLPFQGRWCRDRARLAEWRPAAARSEEQRAELPDRTHASVRGRYRSKGAACLDGPPRQRRTTGFRHRLLSRRSWTDVGPGRGPELDQVD